MRHLISTGDGTQMYKVYRPFSHHVLCGPAPAVCDGRSARWRVCTTMTERRKFIGGRRKMELTSLTQTKIDNTAHHSYLSLHTPVHSSKYPLCTQNPVKTSPPLGSVRPTTTLTYSLQPLHAQVGSHKSNNRQRVRGHGAPTGEATRTNSNLHGTSPVNLLLLLLPRRSHTTMNRRKAARFTRAGSRG